MSFTDFPQLTYIIFQSVKKNLLLKRLKKKKKNKTREEHKHEAANLRRPRKPN